MKVKNGLGQYFHMLVNNENHRDETDERDGEAMTRNISE